MTGSIRCFCICNKIPVAIIAVFGPANDAFEGLQSTIQELNSFSLNNSCIFKVEKISIIRKFQAVPVSFIQTKCVHIPIKAKPFDFIVTTPNAYEHH